MGVGEGQEAAGRTCRFRSKVRKQLDELGEVGEGKDAAGRSCRIRSGVRKQQEKLVEVGEWLKGIKKLIDIFVNVGQILESNWGMF